MAVSDARLLELWHLVNSFLLAKPAKVFPLFSRPTPSVTTQPPPEGFTPTYPSSQPIDFTSSCEVVLQTLEASTPPPTRSLPKKWKSVPSNNGESGGLSAEDPIILDIPPARTKSLPIKANFGSRAPFKLKNKKGFGSLDTPLPTEETQHVRGLQTLFENNNVDIPFERRARSPIASTNSGRPLTSSLAGIISYPQNPPVSSNQHPTPPPLPPFEITPEYLNQHLVFKKFSDTASSPDEKQHTADLWVNKWAPRRARHVLGNELEALYLRDWLQASEINSFSGSADPPVTSTPGSSSQSKKKPPPKRGTKRPRIRREVGSRKAKKRRRGDDDWIVHDDQVEYHPLDDYLEDSETPDCDGTFSDESPEAKAPVTELPPLAYFPPDISNLSNTIILCGPSGSGKTAAVFACAAELGWEVFEVYPGIGKRSGAALETLIGQVGRNHLVTKQGRRHLSPALEKDNALTRFLGVSGAKIQGEPGSVDGTSDGTDIPNIAAMEIASDDGLGVPAPPPQDDRPPAVESVQKLQAQAKQSLILLEEVDILYRDDVNFWPTVINIIRDCRRPVILTCNGAWCSTSSFPCHSQRSSIQKPIFFRWINYPFRVSDNSSNLPPMLSPPISPPYAALRAFNRTRASSPHSRPTQQLTSGGVSINAKWVGRFDLSAPRTSKKQLETTGGVYWINALVFLSGYHNLWMNRGTRRSSVASQNIRIVYPTLIPA